MGDSTTGTSAVRASTTFLIAGPVTIETAGYEAEYPDGWSVTVASPDGAAQVRLVGTVTDLRRVLTALAEAGLRLGWLA